MNVKEIKIDKGIEIIIKTATDKRFSLYTFPHLTIGDIKNSISIQKNIPKEKIILKKGDKFLGNDEIIRNCGITDKSRLFLFLKGIQGKPETTPQGKPETTPEKKKKNSKTEKKTPEKKVFKKKKSYPRKRSSRKKSYSRKRKKKNFNYFRRKKNFSSRKNGSSCSGEKRNSN